MRDRQQTASERLNFLLDAGTKIAAEIVRGKLMSPDHEEAIARHAVAIAFYIWFDAHRASLAASKSGADTEIFS